MASRKEASGASDARLALSTAIRTLHRHPAGFGKGSERRAACTLHRIQASFQPRSERSERRAACTLHRHAAGFEKRSERSERRAACTLHCIQASFQPRSERSERRAACTLPPHPSFLPTEKRAERATRGFDSPPATSEVADARLEVFPAIPRSQLASEARDTHAERRHSHACQGARVTSAAHTR